MKKNLLRWLTGGIFLTIISTGEAFSQIGLHVGEPIEPVRVQSGVGFDTGVKGGSALEQLENMSGGKVNVPRVNPAAVVTSAARVNSAAANAAAMNTMVTGMIMQGLLNSLFSNNSANNQAALEAQRQKAALEAQRAEALRRYNDSIAQAKYEKMMQSYKLLNDPNGLTIKTLSTGNLQFKGLDNLSAPMTMAERERQNLIKKGVNVTWDYNSWAQVPVNSNRIEETPVGQESEPDKYLNSAIDKIETFQGGRIAALAGRYMLNIKKETMSYLNDATDAALSGNVAKMDEVGNVDLRARISSNALYSTGVQTANAYVEQGKSYLSGKLDDAKNDANFALMKSGGQELLKRYDIYSHVSDEWKVGLRKY